jgi:hypothetical protein
MLSACGVDCVDRRFAGLLAFPEEKKVSHLGRSIEKELSEDRAKLK